MNTKICPNCNEVNSIQAASCPRCGRQFKTTAPLNNIQNDPQTVVGSFSPNFSQQNQNQPNNNQQPNFGQQPNFNQPFPNQQRKKSNAGWWIAGGIAGVLIIGFIGVLLLGVFGAIIVANNQTLEGTTWRSAAGVKWVFGTNERYSSTAPNGGSVEGNLKINGNYCTMKPDDGRPAMSFKWTISGNTLTVVDQKSNGIQTLQRTE